MTIINIPSTTRHAEVAEHHAELFRTLTNLIFTVPDV
jgi:hypothetical protein